MIKDYTTKQRLKHMNKNAVKRKNQILEQLKEEKEENSQKVHFVRNGLIIRRKLLRRLSRRYMIAVANFVMNQELNYHINRLLTRHIFDSRIAKYC